MRRAILEAIGGDHPEETIEPMQALIAVTKGMMRFCSHCTFERGDRTLVFHTQTNEDEAKWDDTIATIRSLK
jgi:hypothetical protein